MKRFLSTTAIVLTMTGAAFADAHTEGFGSVAVEETDFLASDLIGMRIYNSEAEVENDATIAEGAEQEWDDIGEINDIIVSKDGEVTAVILGIGGFLGMGERDVSISMDKIRILNDEGGDRFLVVNTSKEMLEQSPEFERRMNDDAEAQNMTDEEKMANADDKNVTVVTGNTDTSENIEAETEEMAQEAEAETKEMANEVEAETEEMANEVEAESEEMANEAEQMAENAEAETEQAVDGENTTVITGDATEERELLPRPEVEREGYQAAEAGMIEQMSAEDLEGSYVYGANDETVGEIDSLLIGDNGKIDRVVINVGGFLGLGEKPVAVTFDELQVLKNVEGDDVRIYIDSTEERLESQPEYQGD
ncbi:PRC-barrel domain-containing protein [Sulfitobacter sp. S0837]|uniref:PRC-barrel domain-containing protein n=1 Tax=Sulfitobacter maritimus TaxID=2741719 RepID=UPI001583F9D7|nr:PRC-barrel domain-containing protein [Sulfitobacter maritimus]NUH65025.1 PRC-barrel domain-containing protein [Sulfitobacter maritimus]